MKKTVYLMALLLVVLIPACAGEEEEKDALKSEVNEVHDEAMGKMGTLVRLQKQLTQVADSLQNDSTSDHSQQVSEIRNTITGLKAADVQMMDWMHRYSEALSDSMPHEEEMEFLTREKQNMEDVRKNMNAAIDKAEAMLNEGVRR